MPERKPVGDAFNGYIIQAGEYTLLSTEAIPGAKTRYTGQFVIRYSLIYLERPYLSIVPGMVALDYGDILTGEAAWDFLLNQSNLHPRADVIGYRNDGEDEMIVVKKLDIARPPRVLVYGSALATMPMCEVEALIGADTEKHPARLLKHLPVYPSLNEWHTSKSKKKL